MIVTPDEMQKIIDRLPKDPKGTEDWIHDYCIKTHYLIFNAKEDWAVCTQCGSVLPGKRYKGAHGEVTTCPECRSEVMILSNGLGRKKYTQYFRVMMFTRRGKTVYGTLWEYDAVFKDPGKPKLKRWLSAIYIINDKERTYYKNHGYKWEKYQTFKLPAAWKPPSYWQTARYEDTYLKNDNLKSIFEKSCLKYLWIPSVIDYYMVDPYRMIQYIKVGMMHQSVELLAKAGFTWLVTGKIDGLMESVVNWRGKCLEKILKLPKRHVKRLKEINPDADELRIFHNLTEEEKNLMTPELMDDLKRELAYKHTHELREHVESYTSFLKWLKYMDDQISVWSADIGMWFDYIGMCEHLGIDLRRNRNLYPEDLRKAHDEAMKKYEAIKNSEIDAKIKKHIREETFEKEDMLIRCAMSQSDLNNESRVLNHCVKAYGEKIARGSCWIWFIRKAEDPDKPYYTMETDTDGHMIQCRGDHNCSMTEEVKAFAEGFEKHLQKQIMKERAERMASAS